MAHITMAVPPPPCLPIGEGSTWTGLFNLSSLSLLSFSELNKTLDTNDYNWWRVLIFFPLELQTRSDWSLARNILLAIQHFHTYNFARITSKEPVCFEDWNCKFSLPIWSRWEPNLTQTTVISHRRRERVSSSAGLLSQSKFSDCRYNMGFCNKSIVFPHFSRKFRGGQPGLLWINFDFRNVIF